MQDTALKILSKLPRVDYADVRVVRNENESIATKDGVVEALESSESLGFALPENSFTITKFIVDSSWFIAIQNCLFNER